MKLSEWAKLNSLSYKTAWKHFKEGRIVGSYQLSTGTIVVPDKAADSAKKEYTVTYARVSSSENKTNLDSQSRRLVDFCNAKGWQVSESIIEVGSGLNDNRPKLRSLLLNEKVTRVVVEHKDRLTRFGFNYIKLLLESRNCEVVIINNVQNDREDLMQDFVSLVTSFCSRLYGLRRSKRKTEKLINELKND